MTPKAANQGTSGSDLDQLRDILYGNQARTVDERLNRLERQLDSTRQQLTDSFGEQLDTLRKSYQEQLAALRKELVDSADKQDKKQSEQVQETQVEFDAKLKQQLAMLETAKNDFSAAIEQLSTEFDRKLGQAQKEIKEQVEKLGSEFRERLHTYQEESRQRDTDLRLEFMALGAWLDDKKASRHDLGHMLMEVGQLLQQEKEPLMDDSKKE